MIELVVTAVAVSVVTCPGGAVFVLAIVGIEANVTTPPEYEAHITEADCPGSST